MESYSVYMFAAGLLLALCVKHFRVEGSLSRPYHVLAILCCVLALWIIVNQEQLRELRYAGHGIYFYLMPLHYVLLLSISPLLYFFFRLLKPPSGRCMLLRVSAHFVLPGLVLVCSLAVYLFMPRLLLLDAFAGDAFEHNFFSNVCRHVLCIQAAFYMVLITRLLRQEQGMSVADGSYQPDLKLRCLIGLMGVGVLVLVVHELLCMQGVSPEMHVHVHLISGCMVAFVFSVSSFAHVGFRAATQLSTGKSVLNTKKYRPCDEETERICALINKVMREEKLYLNASFALPVLSERCGLSPNLISNVLNARYKQVFCGVETPLSSGLCQESDTAGTACLSDHGGHWLAVRICFFAGLFARIYSLLWHESQRLCRSSRRFYTSSD